LRQANKIIVEQDLLELRRDPVHTYRQISGRAAQNKLPARLI